MKLQVKPKQFANPFHLEISEILMNELNAMNCSKVSLTRLNALIVLRLGRFLTSSDAFKIRQSLEVLQVQGKIRTEYADEEKGALIIFKVEKDV